MAAVRNSVADEYAKKGADVHPYSQASRERIDRTKQLVVITAKYVASVLDKAVSLDLLPLPDASARTFPRLRTGMHVVVWFPCGQQRCIKCFKLLAWRATDLCLRMHARPHQVMSLANGLFCRLCGAYSFQRTCLLSADCRMAPSTKTVQKRLESMLEGRHPMTKLTLGSPRLLGPLSDECYVHV